LNAALNVYDYRKRKVCRKPQTSNEGRWQNYGWRVMSGEGKFVVGAIDSRFSEVLGNG
jgi:hypothetical protein